MAGVVYVETAEPLPLPERFAAVFSNATRGAVPRSIALREDLLRNKLQACISPLNILCHRSAATYGQPCQLLLTLAADLLQSHKFSGAGKPGCTATGLGWLREKQRRSVGIG